MRRPLLEASLGLAGGLLAASILPPGPSGLVRVVLPLGALALAALAPGPVRRLRIALLALAVGVLGAPREDGTLPADHVAVCLGREPVLVTLEGRVAAAPSPRRGGGHAFDLDATTLGADRRPVRGVLRVLLPDGRVPEPGDHVRLLGTARPVRTPTNPGELDRWSAVRRRGRTHLVVVERPGNLTVLRRGSSLSPIRLLARLRRRAAGRLRAALSSPDDTLASGLLLGRRQSIPPETEEAFRRTGTVHLLAVSGLHVGLVTAGLLVTLGALRIPDRVRIPLVLAAVAAYASLAGLRPPVVRAALLAALYLGARLLRRRTASLDLLGATAFVLLIPRPIRAESVGFQLSFVAVLGLILLSRRVSGALFPHREIARKFSSWHRVPAWKRIPRDALHRMLPTSLSAWIATAPLILVHFGVLTPGAVPANLLLVPLLLPALVASTLALALGSYAPPILALPLMALRHGAAVLAPLPGMCVDAARPPVLAVLGAYGVLILLLRCPVWRRRHLLGATALPFLLFLVVLPRTPPEQDRLTVLDVGQGSAILLEQSAGPVMLYDAGAMTPDVGARRIGPVLRSRRIRRLDALVLSHADADHVNAAPYLMRRFRVGRLFVPEAFRASPAGLRLLRVARRHGVPVSFVAAGDHVATFGRVLHPPRGASLSDNDGSIVLKVRIGTRSALLTGDIESEGCPMLERSGHDLTADALLLPHHGARNPALPSLIEAVEPRILLVSAGRGFPSEPTPVGLPLLRTAEHGALTVRCDKDGLAVSGFLQSRQVVDDRSR